MNLLPKIHQIYNIGPSFLTVRYAIRNQLLPACSFEFLGIRFAVFYWGAVVSQGRREVKKQTLTKALWEKSELLYPDKPRHLCLTFTEGIKQESRRGQDP